MKSITIVTLLSLALLLSACGKQQQPKPLAAVPAHHEHKAPHGGALAELGEEYAHLEFVLDPSDGTITCYVLDGELENLLRIAQPRIDVTLTLGPSGHQHNLPLTLTAITSELTQEKPGDCSTFTAPAQADLKGVTAYHGKLAWVEVRGKRFENVDFAPHAGAAHEQQSP